MISNQIRRNEREREREELEAWDFMFGLKFPNS
jgi:hypothetical protein